MPSYVIIVEKEKDIRWSDPSCRVMTAEAYLAEPISPPPRRIVNLCRDFAYLGAGYYVSLLAEARGDRVVPDVRAFSEMDRREIQARHATVLERLLSSAPKMPRSVKTISLHVYFGETEDKRFSELAQAAFERLRSPLLRIDLERKTAWRITSVQVLDPRDIPAGDDDVFRAGLDAYLHRRWHRPKPMSSLFDLAVLRDPDDPLPPSKPRTLERLIDVGREMDVNVTLIERKDYPKLAQFDALFIRETTAVPNHTFRFARRAEREGMPVIDDPSSIVRCTNKVFLAELLRGHGVPTPGTRILTRRNFERIEAERRFPCVVKIPDGSFSIGVEKAENSSQLTDIAERMLKRSEVILLQDFVVTEFDWRIGVLDGEALFAARYFMFKKHWQIMKHGDDGSHLEGPTQAVPIEQVPGEVLSTALNAARLIGRGLYGVDLKQTKTGVFVMEVNDNPNVDVGMEDAALGDELYRRLLRHFLRSAAELQQRRGFRGSGMPPRLSLQKSA